jgi:pimeloyl-ACP methyl ester carboxylesterase
VIAWEESGTGRTAVLVHGNTEDRRSWDLVLPLLEPRLRCIRLDLRGHGASSDADDYSAVAMAGDVAAVVAEAGVDEPPLLVGHSLGAVVVSAYAANAPARGVVNVDQALALRGFAQALQPLGPMLRGDGFHDALGSIFAALGVDRLPPSHRAWAEACHAAARPEVVLGTWDLVLDSSPEELDAIVDAVIGSIKVPYLALHGSEPEPGYADWLQSRVPTATVEVWDGDGHYPHLVEPERFAARVLAFDASI